MVGAVVVLEQLDVDGVGARVGGRIVGEKRPGHPLDGALDVDGAVGHGQDVAGDRHSEALDHRPLPKEPVGDLGALAVQDVLLLVELGVEQVAVLVVAHPLVVLGGVEGFA